jgi:hypothetical protein
VRAVTNTLCHLEDELGRRTENLSSETPDSPARQALLKDWEELKTRKAAILACVRPPPRRKVLQ